MDWSLFVISSALWIFFSEHFIWLKRFEALADHGIPVSAVFLGLSKAIAMATMFNLVIFLFVYGFKASWLWALVVVIGGYVAALVYVLLTRKLQGMVVHKVGWIGMPALSVYIWVAAFFI